MRKRAFTLVELLVVISIIAVLLAVLMPALNKARMNAKMIICATRQKNILTSVIIYTSENNGKLSPSTQGQCKPKNRTEATYWTWPIRLKYYYTTNRVLNGGSVLDILGKYMKDPINWSCPMNNANIDWQKKYFAEMENSLVQMLDCSYMLYWNYLGFYKDYKLSDGTTVSTVPFGFNPVLGKDTLMLTDLFLPADQYNTAGARSTYDFMSAHPFKGSSLQLLYNQYNQTDTSGNVVAVKVFMGDTGSKVPQVKLNAGYLDGHVERFDAATNSITSSTSRYVMPAKWR